MIFANFYRFFTRKSYPVDDVTLATQASELQNKCMLYLGGIREDEVFNQMIEDLSKSLGFSKYEVIEYLLDSEEERRRSLKKD